jgi:hypothetical protein
MSTEWRTRENTVGDGSYRNVRALVYSHEAISVPISRHIVVAGRGEVNDRLIIFKVIRAKEVSIQ